MVKSEFFEGLSVKTFANCPLHFAALYLRRSATVFGRFDSKQTHTHDKAGIHKQSTGDDTQFQPIECGIHRHAFWRIAPDHSACWLYGSRKARKVDPVIVPHCGFRIPDPQLFSPHLGGQATAQKVSCGMSKLS